MTAEGVSTISKLVDLFHLSRSKGEKVSLSMESKDGKDSLTFSLNSPSGSSFGQAGSWTPPPAPSSPWTWPPLPRPWPPLFRRKKTPSQLRRDQRRQQDFFAKKASSAEVKEEVPPKNSEAEKVTMIDPVDEISLTEIPNENLKEAVNSDLFKIVGEYKNPKFKPW